MSAVVWTFTTVMQMLTVLILMVAFSAPVERDSKEMDSHVLVRKLYDVDGTDL